MSKFWVRVALGLHSLEHQFENLQEAVKMKRETKLVWTATASLIVLAIVGALPSAHSKSTATYEQTAATTQSVSGKIAEVQRTSFTLNVVPGHTVSNLGQDLQEPKQKTMTFQIDKNTTVDGKLQVGANADVTYREDNGKLVAISVRVT